MIHKREGYDADYEKIFEKCAENEIVLEINTDPKKFNLNDIMILKAPGLYPCICFSAIQARYNPPRKKTR